VSGPERGDADALRELLRLARSEGALDKRRLPALVEALRERARDVLEPLEREREELRRALIAREQEAAWLNRTIDGFEQDSERLRQMYERASAAHDRLREHHRHVVALAMAGIEEALGRRFAFGAARRRLEALLVTLREELG